MSLLNQYDVDKEQFVELFSKFTGVSKSKLFNFLETNSISTLFEHPTSLDIPDIQRVKIEQLRELRNLYINLKSFDKTYEINSADKAGEYFKEYFSSVKDKERFTCAFLDNSNHIISTQTMTTGTVNQAAVYPREIAKLALLHDCGSVILAHNHPGGTLKASPEDIVVTKKIGDALATLNINILDHIIVADDKYMSFAQKGLSFTSDSDSVFEFSNNIREQIIEQYSKEFTAIKHITERTAQVIDILNSQRDKAFSIKGIKQSYTVAGKKVELGNTTTVDMKTFKDLKEVVEDLKHAQLVEKQAKAHEKAIQNQLPKHNISMEM